MNSNKQNVFGYIFIFSFFMLWQILSLVLSVEDNIEWVRMAFTNQVYLSYKLVLNLDNEMSNFINPTGEFLLSSYRSCIRNIKTNGLVYVLHPLSTAYVRHPCYKYI